VSILVFDSGIGGLSVLREIRVLLPQKQYVYVADDAAFPYGDWDEEPLKNRMVDLFGDLIDRFNPEMIVIACNTASTLGIDALRKAYPSHQFVGTVPAIKPAAERTQSGVVAVLATPGTVARQYTKDLIEQYASQCHVRLIGSTRLAALAETYLRGGYTDEDAVATEIAPCFLDQDGAKTDIVVLACTHYPFLVNRMRKMAPWPVDWIDTSEAIARRAASLATTPDAEAGEKLHRDEALFTSGNVDPSSKNLLLGFGLKVV
jgi:glutamate racemase